MSKPVGPSGKKPNLFSQVFTKIGKLGPYVIRHLKKAGEKLESLAQTFFSSRKQSEDVVVNKPDVSAEDVKPKKDVYAYVPGAIKEIRDAIVKKFNYLQLIETRELKEKINFQKEEGLEDSLEQLKFKLNELKMKIEKHEDFLDKERVESDIDCLKNIIRETEALQLITKKIKEGGDPHIINKLITDALPRKDLSSNKKTGLEKNDQLEGPSEDVVVNKPDVSAEDVKPKKDVYAYVPGAINEIRDAIIKKFNYLKLFETRELKGKINLQKEEGLENALKQLKLKLNKLETKIEKYEGFLDKEQVESDIDCLKKIIRETEALLLIIKTIKKGENPHIINRLITGALPQEDLPSNKKTGLEKNDQLEGPKSEIETLKLKIENLESEIDRIELLGTDHDLDGSKMAQAEEDLKQAKEDLKQAEAELRQEEMKQKS